MVVFYEKARRENRKFPMKKTPFERTIRHTEWIEKKIKKIKKPRHDLT